MRKSRDIKVNNVGKVSCFGLLVLGMMLMNPAVGSSSAYADEVSMGGVSVDGVSADRASADGATADAGIMPAADTGVTITFSPTTGSASLTPTTADGSLAKIDVTANVKIASTGGYTIYLGGKNAALTGTKTGATIPGATTATTFNNMKTNTWGYAYAEGSFVPDTATYSALPQGQGKSLKSVSGNNTNINHTYALSFATKIGNDKPADTYSNQVTLSVTSSPLQITTLLDIDEMQTMTSKICEESAVGDSKQLKDTRDGKYYWVTKLKDNKCWMTQNLDLDLSTSKTLTPSDSDVSANWTPEYATASQATSSTILSNVNGQRSWSLGNYRITNPTASSNCGSGKNSAANCSSQFTSYTTPTTETKDTNAHYILGNHYQWNAATAGTGSSITSGQASSSICPKGWRLPAANTDNGDFYTLITVGGIGTNVELITGAPYYFVRGGRVRQNASYLFDNAANEGYYWSSVLDSASNNSRNLSFTGTNSITPNNNSGRPNGFSVRCIAR